MIKRKNWKNRGLTSTGKLLLLAGLTISCFFKTIIDGNDPLLLVPTSSSSAAGDDVCAKIRDSAGSTSFYQKPGQCTYSESTGAAAPSHLSLSTVVPALRSHSEDLLRLMPSIQAATVPPDEVVIVMTGVGYDGDGDAFCDAMLRKLAAILTRSPIKLACFGEMLLAGPARNVGFMSSRGEIISFMDADDTESPIRNEVSKNVFACRRNRLKVFVHGFSKKATQADISWAAKGVPCIEDDPDVETINATSLYESLSKSTDNGCWIHGKIAHGWPVVHRSVFSRVEFSPSRSMEDCLFLRSVLYTFGPHEETMLFLNKPLGFYLQPSRSSAEFLKQ